MSMADWNIANQSDQSTGLPSKRPSLMSSGLKRERSQSWWLVWALGAVVLENGGVSSRCLRKRSCGWTQNVHTKHVQLMETCRNRCDVLTNWMKRCCKGNKIKVTERGTKINSTDYIGGNDVSWFWFRWRTNVRNRSSANLARAWAWANWCGFEFYFMLFYSQKQDEFLWLKFCSWNLSDRPSIHDL